jgi:hypothetical protein
MTLRCKTCGAENLATNCYCGHCGLMLGQSATNAPEGFWRAPNGGNQARHVEASADLPPKLTGFDQTPLIADEGTNRRLHPPSAMAEQDRLKREAEINDCLRRGDKTQFEARSKEEAERKRHEEIVGRMEAELESLGIFMRWNIKEAANAPASDAANVTATSHAIVDSASKSGATRPPDHRNLVAGGEKVAGQKTVRTGVPSSPVLTDGTVTRHNGEKRAVKSHSQSYIALAVLAAAVILVSLQWDSIRDYAMPYVQNSSLQAKPHEMQASAPPAIAADSPSRVPHKVPSAVAGRSAVRSRPHIPSAPSGTAPAPGAGEPSQAADPDDAGIVTARLWIAVAEGNPQATVELAKMYEAGDGVVQNCDQAQVLLRAAAAKGNAQAKLDLQQIQLRGDCSAR